MYRKYFKEIEFMCLAIPMQVTMIDGFNAKCEAKGIERDASLFMLQQESVSIGDFVLIHVGYAIQKFQRRKRLVHGKFMTKCF